MVDLRQEPTAVDLTHIRGKSGVGGCQGLLVDVEVAVAGTLVGDVDVNVYCSMVSLMINCGRKTGRWVPGPGKLLTVCRIRD